MPQCKKCGSEIIFKIHPQAKKPGQLAPFDPDGEIHFATCKNKGEEAKTEYSSPDQILCNYGHSCDQVFWGETRGGKRLKARCPQNHTIMIPITAGNKMLVNREDELLANSWHMDTTWGSRPIKCPICEEEYNEAIDVDILTNERGNPGEIGITFNCETGHKWAVCLEFRKGCTYFERMSLPD